MTNTNIGPYGFKNLQARLQGTLLTPDDVGYDEACQVWNAMIDRKPALIARCVSVGDVIVCVNFARKQGLLVSIKGGGHNVTGSAVCEGGLMIDLSLMKGIKVDDVTCVAHVEGGVLWGELDEETQKFGLATTGGVHPKTGMGLMLGGGHGWLMCKHGLTCDNLLSADVVTADGRFLTASVKENSDLFWGIRGGGGNFGIITSFEFQLHPVGPKVLGGMMVYPIEKAKETLRFYGKFTREAPDELTAYAVLTTALDGSTPIIAIAICYSGDIEKGEQIIRPLKEFGQPLRDTICPMAYTEVQDMLTASNPDGLRWRYRSGFVEKLSDDAIEAIMTSCGTFPLPSRFARVVIEHIGGVVSRVDWSDTAYPHRGGWYNVTAITGWEGPEDDARNTQWVKKTGSAIRNVSSSGGAYLNYLDQGESIDRIRAAYGQNYQRLVGLKDRYDPDNLFRLNQNIMPSA